MYAYNIIIIITIIYMHNDIYITLSWTCTIRVPYRIDYIYNTHIDTIFFCILVDIFSLKISYYSRLSLVSLPPSFSLSFPSSSFSFLSLSPCFSYFFLLYLPCFFHYSTKLGQIARAAQNVDQQK